MNNKDYDNKELLFFITLRIYTSFLILICGFSCDCGYQILNCIVDDKLGTDEQSKEMI